MIAKEIFTIVSLKREWFNLGNIGIPHLLAASVTYDLLSASPMTYPPSPAASVSDRADY